MSNLTSIWGSQVLIEIGVNLNYHNIYKKEIKSIIILSIKSCEKNNIKKESKMARATFEGALPLIMIISLEPVEFSGITKSNFLPTSISKEAA